MKSVGLSAGEIPRLRQLGRARPWDRHRLRVPYEGTTQGTGASNGSQEPRTTAQLARPPHEGHVAVDGGDGGGGAVPTGMVSLYTAPREAQSQRPSAVLTLRRKDEPARLSDSSWLIVRQPGGARVGRGEASGPEERARSVDNATNRRLHAN